MTKVTVPSGIWFCFMCVARLSYAQTDTELYLFSLQKTSDSLYHVYAPKYLSGFNAGGDTNQPSFTPSGDLLISVRKAGETQNDIWQLSLTQKKIKRLTETSGSEYSPRIHPDGKNLSVLRKEPGEVFDQQVYTIGLRSGEYKSVTGDIRDIGNYTWMSSHELGLYRIGGKDNGLSYLDINVNKIRRITTSVGRTLLTDKNGLLVYVHKFDSTYWYIKKYNPATSFIEVVAVTPGNTEDFALTPDGTYFMAKDHILYCINPAQQKIWDQVADLSIYDIKFITGLAISEDGHQLALVAMKEKP